MRPLAAALVVLACAGCLPEPGRLGAGVGYCRDLSGPVPLLVDLHWSADEVDTILAAADRWSDAVGVQWEVTADVCHVGRWVESCVTQGWDDPGRIGGDAMPDVAGVVVYTRELERSGASLESVVTHELGHYIGAEHGSGVMAPVIDGDLTIAADVLASCSSG